MNLVQIIQQIALKAVLAAQPVEFVCGTVIREKPLKIMLSGEMGLELDQEFLVLTESVIEKKITIDKHTHSIGSTVAGHTHTVAGTCATGGAVEGTAAKSTSLTSMTEIDDTVLSGKCTEHGNDLTVESDSDKLVITINEPLKENDKVLMFAVNSGQTYVILSRVFEFKD